MVTRSTRPHPHRARCRSHRPALRRALHRPCPGRSPRHSDAIDDLVEAHRGIALKLARDAVDETGQPELENALTYCALRGLRQAATRYDPTRNNTFATYAWWRVRGAVLDGLHHFADRAARRRRQAWCREHPRREPLSCRPSATARRGAHGDQGSPEAMCIAAQRQRAVRRAVECLREPYRSLVSRSFFEGDSLTELAREHGRSRSWASRKRTQALEQLARHLAAFAE